MTVLMTMLENTIFVLCFFHSLTAGCSVPLAPALYVFGDSLADSGNNNLLPTLAKANYFPYGADFNLGSTGRFTNGRTVPDFISQHLGLPFSPPYVTIRKATPLTGMNYASGSCGILPETGSALGKCLSLGAQLDLFRKTVHFELPMSLQNPKELKEHLSKSIFVIIIGSNDYLNNYLQPHLFPSSKLYAPQPFAELLIDKLSDSFESLYNLGARKVVMFEIGPIGCTPSVTRKPNQNGECAEENNQLVAYFNSRLPAMLRNLTSTLQGSRFILGQVNSLSYHAIKNPSEFELIDGKNPCCTAWANGTSGCIPALQPCKDPNKHFFWDAFHLTEAVYSILASRFLADRSFKQLLEIRYSPMHLFPANHRK